MNVSVIRMSFCHVQRFNGVYQGENCTPFPSFRSCLIPSLPFLSFPSLYLPIPSLIPFCPPSFCYFLLSYVLLLFFGARAIFTSYQKADIILWLLDVWKFMFVTVFDCFVVGKYSLAYSPTDLLFTVSDNNRSRRSETLPLHVSHQQQRRTTIHHSLILFTLKSYRTPRRKPESTIITLMSRPRTIVNILRLLYTPNSRELESN